MKTCLKCGISKDRSEFYKQSRMKDGLQPRCKQCVAAQQKEYRDAHPDKMEKVSARRRWFRHGLSEEQYTLMVSKFDGKCWICKDQEGSCVDHDHSCCPGSWSCGKCVRGWLCHSCNLGLGKFKDSADLLTQAAEYLGSVV